MRQLFLTLMTMPLAALTLQEAEMQALKSNVAIQLTHQDVKQYDSRHLQAVLSWLPEVTFGSMYAKLQKSQKISHLQKQNHLFSNQFALTQPIFSPDLLGDLRLTKIAQQGALAGQEIAVNDTLLQVRLQFLDVLIKQQAVDVEKEVVGYLRTSYGDEQKKYDAGSATAFEVSQVKTALSQEITKYYGALKDLGDAKQQLNLTLHNQETGPLENTVTLETYPLLKEKFELLKATVSEDQLEPSFALFTPQETEQWIGMARQNRPELKRSQIFVQAAQEKSNQSKMQYLPKIEAFADYGYYQPINGQFLRQRNDFAGGVQLSWSLFDSFKREAKVGEIAALKKAAGIAYQFETDKVESTIKNDLHQLEEAFYVYLHALEASDLAEKAVEEMRVRLSSGRATDLDLENAARMFSQAKLQKQQTEFLVLKSYFQLRHDAGLDATTNI